MHLVENNSNLTQKTLENAIVSRKTNKNKNLWNFAELILILFGLLQVES